jgi:hypothetical protein
MNKYLVYIIPLGLLIACNKQYEVIKFSQNQHVKTEIVIEDLAVQTPSDIFIIDSILVVQDVRAHERYLKYYDINKNEMITEFGMRGKGPDELITPYLSYVDADSYQIYLYDPNLMKIHIFDTEKYSDKPDCIINLDTQQENHSRIFYVTHPKNKFVYGMGLLKDGYLAAIDTKEQRIDYFGNYPIKPRKSNSLNIADACNGMLKLTPDKQHLIVTTNKFGYIACYETDSNLPRLKWEKNISKILYKMEGQRILFSPNNKTGTMSMALSDDKIFLLYHGGEFRYYNSMATEHAPKTIMVFSIDGSPLALYHLDRPAIRIAIDQSENIYCISKESQYNLVKIKL